MAGSRRPRTGVTLLEMLVAMVISTLVIGMIAGYTKAVIGATRALTSSQLSWSEREAGRRTLTEVVRGTILPSHDRPFRGDAARMEFTSASRRAQDGYRPAAIVVAFINGALVMTTDGQESLTIRSSLLDVRIEYLSPSRGSSSWVPDWHSTSLSPRAVRMQLTERTSARGLAVDTLLVVVGLP